MDVSVIFYQFEVIIEDIYMQSKQFYNSYTKAVLQ